MGGQSEQVGKYGQVMFACQGEGGDSVTYIYLLPVFRHDLVCLTSVTP